MGIEPESKDWTWVLNRQCPECGENVGTLSIAQMVEKLQSLAPQWRTEISQPGVAVQNDKNTWSRLQYAAHVRDGLAVFAERVNLMLTADSPTFPDWDQDAAAETGRYSELDPARTATEVAEAIVGAARLLENLDPATYARPGLRSDGAPFTVQTLSQYFTHDVAHHLMDVRRQR